MRSPVGERWRWERGLPEELQREAWERRAEENGAERSSPAQRGSGQALVRTHAARTHRGREKLPATKRSGLERKRILGGLKAYL
jgi:hypothetical protein